MDKPSLCPLAAVHQITITPDDGAVCGLRYKGVSRLEEKIVDWLSENDGES